MLRRAPCLTGTLFRRAGPNRYSRAYTRAYKGLEEGTQAIKKFEPGYDNARKSLRGGYADARATLKQIPSDHRSDAISDAQKYVENPTDELRQKLLAYKPSGKELLAGADKVAASVRDKDYIGGESVRQQMEDEMQDGIMFRTAYGEILADHFHVSGQALRRIWEEKHMLREVAAGRRFGPFE